MKLHWVLVGVLVGVSACNGAEDGPGDGSVATNPVVASSAEQAPGADAGASAATEGTARRAFGQLPMRYEANRGQHDARARYVGRQGALTLFATDGGPVLALRVPEAETIDQAPGGSVDALAPAERPGAPEVDPRRGSERQSFRVHTLRLRLEGAHESARIDPGDLLVTRSNYFIGDDPTKWRTNIPNYGSLRYRELAPGVDLVLRGSAEGRMEYDFVVAPGTSPELAMRFEGANRVRVGEGGGLEVYVGGTVLEQPAPVLYQEVHGRRVSVQGAYVVTGLDGVRFEVGEHDRSRPLVIDPVLVYGTYLGGSNSDEGRGIAVDASGAAYVTGVAASANFPTSGAYQGTWAGGTDAFVAKLTPAGDALAYATYLGGSERDYAWGIAVDASGAAYVAGETHSTNFPTSGGYQAMNAGGGDAFVAKLSAVGDALAYATYLGGSSYEQAYGIAVDDSGAAYVTGSTESTNFPTSGAYQGAFAGGSYDAFVAKLSAAGDALVYATYLGGSSADAARGIAVDASGAAYLTGDTDSTDFPTSGAYQAAFAGVSDAFVAKLSATGDALAYATYVGGSDDDAALGIAVDASGAAYVTGYTGSTDFPTSGAYQAVFAGGGDAFVAKLSAAGDALAYATYLGGSGWDEVLGIAVDSSGAAYVTGYTESTNFPTSGAYQATNAGGRDAFVAKLSAGGDALAYATYLGGSSERVRPRYRGGRIGGGVRHWSHAFLELPDVGRVPGGERRRLRRVRCHPRPPAPERRPLQRRHRLRERVLHRRRLLRRALRRRRRLSGVQRRRGRGRRRHLRAVERQRVRRRSGVHRGHDLHRRHVRRWCLALPLGDDLHRGERRRVHLQRVPGRHLLRRRHRGERLHAVLCRHLVGGGIHELHRVDRLRARELRRLRRHRHGGSHVQRVHGRYLRVERQRRGVHGVERLPGGQLRCVGRHRHRRPHVQRMRGGHVLGERERGVVYGVERLRARQLRGRHRHRHGGPHVRRVRSRHVLGERQRGVVHGVERLRGGQLRRLRRNVDGGPHVQRVRALARTRRAPTRRRARRGATARRAATSPPRARRPRTARAARATPARTRRARTRRRARRAMRAATQTARAPPRAWLARRAPTRRARERARATRGAPSAPAASGSPRHRPRPPIACAPRAPRAWRERSK